MLLRLRFKLCRFLMWFLGCREAFDVSPEIIQLAELMWPIIKKTDREGVEKAWNGETKRRHVLYRFSHKYPGYDTKKMAFAIEVALRPRW